MHVTRAAEIQTQAFAIWAPDRATEAEPKIHETVLQSGSRGSQATKITPGGHGKPQGRLQERQGPQLTLGCMLKHPSGTTNSAYVAVSISHGFGQRTTRCDRRHAQMVPSHASQQEPQLYGKLQSEPNAPRRLRRKDKATHRWQMWALGQGVASHSIAAKRTTNVSTSDLAAGTTQATMKPMRLQWAIVLQTSEPQTRR